MSVQFYEVNPSVVEYLKGYKGNWHVLHDIRAKYYRYNKLSQKQQDLVVRAMNREKDQNKPTKEKVFTFKAGDKIGISQPFAQKLSAEKKISPFFCNLLVTKVHNETARAVQVSVLFSSEVAFTCNMCRRPLTCEISQACGIGPVCYGKLKGKRPSLDRAKEMLKEIEAYAKDQGEVKEIWIPKSCIKTQESNELANELLT
jgi:hypothetical protein